EGALKRLRPIWHRVVEIGGALCIDMESYGTKDITLEIFRRLRAESQGRLYPHLGIVVQAYLKDSERDVADLVSWLRGQQLTAEVRLVKGAYWDYETIHAAQCGREAPVWGQKAETDGAFER